MDIRMKTDRLLFFAVLMILMTGCSQNNNSSSNPDVGGDGTTGRKGFETLDDISDKRVGVLLGSVYDVFVAGTYPNAKILQIDKSPDLGVALVAGQCDVGITNIVEAADLLHTYSDLAIFTQDFMSLDVGMGFNKNDRALCEQFNTFLAGIRANGLLEEITRRWIDSTAQARMPILDFKPSGLPPLRVGTPGENIPYTYIKDGELAGLDIEVLTRFAAAQGRKIKYSLMSFASMIPSITAGKVDVIAKSVVITPERAKQVLFSDSYFRMSTCALALKKNIAAYDDAEETTVQKSFFIRVADSFYNNIIAEKRYLLILDGLWQTILISVFAVLLGTVLGAAVCFMRMSRRKSLNAFAGCYIALMRGMPILVLLMLTYYVVFASWDISATVVAILTFAMNFAAYVSEMFRTSIQGVDRGQREAGIAMGFTGVQTFIFIILPQAVKTVMPVYKGEVISLVKTTSVVGYIAVQDLTKASDIIRSRTFDAFFPLIMVAIIYFLLSWLLASGLDYLNRKTTSAQ